MGQCATKSQANNNSPDKLRRSRSFNGDVNNLHRRPADDEAIYAAKDQVLRQTGRALNTIVKNQKRGSRFSLQDVSWEKPEVMGEEEINYSDDFDNDSSSDDDGLVHTYAYQNNPPPPLKYHEDSDDDGLVYRNEYVDENGNEEKLKMDRVPAYRYGADDDSDRFHTNVDKLKIGKPPFRILTSFTLSTFAYLGIMERMCVIMITRLITNTVIKTTNFWSKMLSKNPAVKPLK